ncbi:hypothetical protein EG864_14925, partial [Enterococcus faecalis]
VAVPHGLAAQARRERVRVVRGREARDVRARHVHHGDARAAPELVGHGAVGHEGGVHRVLVREPAQAHAAPRVVVADDAHRPEGLAEEDGRRAQAELGLVVQDERDVGAADLGAVGGQHAPRVDALGLGVRRGHAHGHLARDVGDGRALALDDDGGGERVRVGEGGVGGAEEEPLPRELRARGLVKVLGVGVGRA